MSGVQKPGFNSGTGIGQYSFIYNNTNQVKAVVDELGNRSTFVWDSFGNRAAVIDPFGQRTSYIYDSLGRLSAVRNALGQRATQTYDTQGAFWRISIRWASGSPMHTTSTASSARAPTRSGTSRRRCMTT